MALTLVSTVGAEDANSYVTVEFCDSYWQGNHQATKAAQWVALSSTQKASSLISACRILESIRFTYKFQPHTSDGGYEYDRSSGLVIELVDRSQPTKSAYHQALQFPRNVDRESVTGDLFIPEAIGYAQCEQAVYLLTFDESAISTRLQGITSDSTTVGPISIKQTFGPAGSSSSIAPMALDLVKPFVLAYSRKIRRG